MTSAFPDSPASGDLAARRIAALVRVVLAFTIAAAASVEAFEAPPWFAWAAGLVWLPFASWLWFAEEGPPDHLRTRLAFTADVFAVVVAMASLPAHADIILAGIVPLSAIVAYRNGPLTALAVGAVAVTARAGFAAVGRVPAVDPLLLAVETASIVGVVVLVGRALAVQRRDAASVRHFAERSDLILSRSSEAIVVTDAGGWIQQANPAARSTLTGDPEGGVDGLHCADLDLHDASGPLDCTRTCALAALCADGTDHDIWRVEGDERRPFLASASRLSGQGVGEEFVHSFRDVTRLRQADEAKTMFLATASHELKTPLTVIRGFTQILKATADDPQSVVALDAIDTRSAELVKIVDRLLLSSRIEAGRVELQATPIDVGALVQERMTTLATTLGRLIEVDAPAPMQAVGAASALATALEHLVDNAAKYSPNGDPIEVRTERLPGEVVITVSDRGIGMSPDQAEHCFDKFWQAEASDVRRFGGTGIGLYIVRSLVTAMGGRIDVRSRLGEGSTFTIGLPVTLPEDRPARPPRDRTSVDDFLAHLGLPAGAGS